MNPLLFVWKRFSLIQKISNDRKKLEKGLQDRKKYVSLQRKR